MAKLRTGDDGGGIGMMRGEAGRWLDVLDAEGGRGASEGAVGFVWRWALLCDLGVGAIQGASSV